MWIELWRMSRLRPSLLAGAGIESRGLADPGGFQDGAPGRLLGRHQWAGRPGQVNRR
jgi:hypothetical protein